MGITRDDLKRSGRWLEVSDEEWEQQKASVQQAIDGYLKNDLWAPKIKLPLLILLISHAAGRCYLKGSIETHKKLGYWLAVSYDNFINPEEPEVDYNTWLPPKDMMDQIDTFMLTHYQTWGGVSYPFMWSLKISSGFAQNFKYVYCINGDCIIEKPEGFPEFLDFFIKSDADIMSSGPVCEREIGTAGLLMKSQAFARLADHLIDHVVPLEAYEKSTQEFGNTEGRLAVAARELGLKQLIVEPPYNEQLHKPGFGYWYKTIGFRHIHGEHNFAYRYKGIPPDAKYFDGRFMGDEYSRIKEYSETKDERILEQWWAKD